ncbi:MAG: biopolymer transporter ExbD [Myxococcota bacterium]
MGSRLGGAEDDVIADINITPFVDIILVVLIIFMVTATTIVKQSIKVELPEAASGEATDSSFGLTLGTDGALLLDGEPTTADGVRSTLRAAKASGKDVVVLISADKLVAHGRVVWAIDLVKSEGVGKFAINIDKTQTIPPDPGAAPGGG